MRVIRESPRESVSMSQAETFQLFFTEEPKRKAIKTLLSLALINETETYTDVEFRERISRRRGRREQ